MIKLDLITGFLAAGKTHFIRAYAEYLLAKGEKIGILVGDNGAVNIDAALLKDLQGERCEMEMLAGAGDIDCIRRRMRTKLISMAMLGCGRLLMEPSGAFDAEELYDLLNEAPLDKWYEIGSVIAVIDARRQANMPQEALHLMASQAASAGCWVFSHADCASEEELQNAPARLGAELKAIGCMRNVEKIPVFYSSGTLKDDEYAAIESCGWMPSDHVHQSANEGGEFQSLYYFDLPVSRKVLTEKIDILFSDFSYGQIFRVKGFFKENETWYEINASAGDMAIAESDATRGIIVVIGLRLHETAINTLIYEGLNAKNPLEGLHLLDEQPDKT